MKTKQELIEALRRADGRYAIQDIIAVTEFKGKEGVDYPNVPISEGVNLEALTEGDEKPFFVTLRIGEAGVTSGNGVYYGDEEVNEIMRQVVTKRPTGGPGHLKSEELASALPLNPAHWVGAVRVNEFTWGKAYVAPSETREWLRRLGATNSEIATSIFGYAEELMWDEQHEAIRMVLHPVDESGSTGFMLEYVDFASPERAGVPSLATVPHITSEMNQGAQPRNEGEVDKFDVLKALTAEDVQHLPAVVVQAITGKVAEVGLVGELRAALGLDEKADVVASVKELVQKDAQREAAAVAAAITAKVAEGVKVEALRSIIAQMVTDAQPKTVADVPAVFEQVMGREAVKELLKAQIAQPRQERPAQQATSGGKFFNIPARD